MDMHYVMTVAVLYPKQNYPDITRVGERSPQTNQNLTESQKDDGHLLFLCVHPPVWNPETRELTCVELPSVHLCGVNLCGVTCCMPVQSYLYTCLELTVYLW